MKKIEETPISKRFLLNALEIEQKTLHPKAAHSLDHSRLRPEKEDYRLPYKRDVDRIVHSKAFGRYFDKTQVVYLVENDHITHRGQHVQLVSSFAKGIAEMLNLNLDLVEAIALGHDVGHPPFGHEGEGYLSALSCEYGEGPFTHPWQSCRLFSEIVPLNLCLAVYDGFLCHDGGMKCETLKPHFGKTWETHRQELKQKFKDPEYHSVPCSLEGCLVKICDTISYLGRDIEDAIRLGIIERASIPKTSLGNTNADILGTLALDLIENSYQKDSITISKERKEDLAILRQFNFEHIYTHPKLKVESTKVLRSYRILFETLLDDYSKHKETSFLWKNFLSDKSEEYLEKNSPVRQIIDYISGMTDRFFIRIFEKLIVPKQIEIFQC